jgi:glycosyltransferase involved in cell wall biosynthesis
VPSKDQLKIAVFFPYRSIINGADGGGASYEKAIGDVFASLRSQLSLELVFMLPAKARSEIRRTDEINGVTVRYYKPTLFERIFSSSNNPLVTSWIVKLGLLRTEKELKSQHVDLVYFSSPSSMALRLQTLPYIFTVWDLGHRDLPFFPEMGAYREWVFRERLYQIAVPRAVHVMVDSPTTGKRLEDFYGLVKDRWSPVGLLPGIPNQLPPNPLKDMDYIIYPAARWPHKNHLMLLEAMISVLPRYPNLKLVLTGKDEGFDSTIQARIVELKLTEAVIDRGFVSKEETLALISGAKLLVMPSLLGPTNLPPLEALMLGVPAVVSDVHEYGSEVDPSLKLVPADDSEAWAEAICSALEKTDQIPITMTLSGAIETHKQVLRNFDTRVRKVQS